jgi:hypothetical protein
MLQRFITSKLVVFEVISEHHNFLCGQHHVGEGSPFQHHVGEGRGAPFNKIYKSLSQAYERPFIQYKWYDAERAQYLAYMEYV